MPLKPEQVKALVAASVDNKKFTRISDGNSLYLMTRNGRGYWSFLYKQNNSLRTKMLGTAADLSPNQARQKRNRFNVERRSGEGVVEMPRGVPALPVPTRTAHAEPAQPAGKLFGEVVTEYLDREALSQKEAAAYRRTLGGPLAQMDVAAIDTPDIERHLAAWADKPPTWKKTVSRIEKILDVAKAKNYRTGDNPARWKGHFEHLSPKKPDVEHHETMDEAAVPALIRELVALDTPASRSLAFCILTAARAEEVRGMRWSQVAGNVWNVPGERMKQRKAHTVPLSQAAIKLLGKPGNGFVFPSRYGDKKPLGHNAMLELLNTLRPGAGTVHGMRTTFSTWAAKAGYSMELREMALAHAVNDPTFRAYNRNQLTELRRPMMLRWSKFAAGK
jgi:integrase